MRIVVTGSGRAGSWQIRGEQIGRALGAVVYRDAHLDVLRSADVVVAVKRVGERLAADLRACGRPVAWDAQDFYGQDDQSGRDELVRRARLEMERIGATAVVGATRRMADDLGSPYHLRHHGWDRGRAVVRDRLGVVAYEGRADYLGSHRSWIESECRRRGIKFVVNPSNYLSADVVVATRGAPYDTYASRSWKSGVKLANAQVAGIPFAGRRESGYVEQSSGAEEWFDDLASFSRALDALESRGSRERAAELMLSAAPHLPVVAAELRRILEAVR